MTAFAESFTTQNLLPPWSTIGARTWMFVAKVPTDNIELYLDKSMNSAGPDTAPYHYAPWDGPGFGILSLVDHLDFASLAIDGKRRNRVRHKELIWSFPAVRYRRTADNLLVERTLVWIQPFYFDTNAFITFSSREIWGGEKGVAQILLADDSTAEEFHCDVALNGFASFSPRSKVHSMGAVHIRGSCADASVTRKDLRVFIDEDEDMSKILASFGEILPADWLAEDPSAHFAMPPIEVNTVKQYRDALDPSCASYRALVASRITHSAAEYSGYLPGSEVDIRFMWSDSFKDQLTTLLGLPEPDAAYQKGHMGTGMRIDDDGMDWNLPAVRLPIMLSLCFATDAQFEVTNVLHTYGNGPHYPEG